MAGKEVRFDIVATDKASKPLDQVADKAEKVEALDPTVDVKADTAAADHTVEGFADQLDKLTDTDKVVVLALRAGAAAVELRDLAGDLALIDAADPDIDVKFARYAEVSGQLDQLETQMHELGTSGSADMDKVSAKLDGIGESAGNAKGAVHSMAGNAVGDFAATATGIGPLGEALGQLTEQAAGAEGSIKDIALAGVGMAGLAAAMYVVQKVMKSIADTKAFHTAEVDAYTKSIQETGDALGDLNDRLREAGKVMGAPGFGNAQAFLGLSDAVRDVTADLHQVGLDVDDYTALVGQSKDRVLEWAQAQLDAGTNAKAVANALVIITAAQADLAAANDAAVVSSKFFNDQQAAQRAETDRLTGAARAYQAAHKDAAKATDDTADASDRAADALRRQRDQLGFLQDQISKDQAWIDLGAQFDAVRKAGDDAIAAQVEANKTRGKSAKDAKADQDAAEEAMRAFETATNNAKLAVIDYGTKILGLPPDKVISIITDLDNKGITDAEKQIAELKKQAEIRIKFLTTSGAGFLLTGGGGPGTNMAPTTSVVNNFLARPPSGRETARTAARWSRINGR